jgi:diguanylate cyclase (GGDEF)-like protein
VRQATPEAIYRHDFLRWRATSTALSLAAAIGLIVVALFPDTGRHDQTVFLAGAVGALALAALARLTPVSPAPAWVLASTLGSTALITALVATADHTAALPCFYVLPLLSASYLLPLEGSIAVSLLASVSLAVALAVRPAGFDLLLLAEVALVNTGVSVAARRLRRGRDRLIGELERVASTDGLTGLANRGTLDQVAERLVRRAQIDKTPLALVIFDIDHFKRLNDTHGHAVGDAALRGFAATLQAQSRPTDLIARIGGEEFVAVMPGIHADEAGAFAERVGDALRGHHSGIGARITVSAGVAPMGADDTVDTLLREADSALYAAKGAGRDRVVLAELVTFPGSGH